MRLTITAATLLSQVLPAFTKEYVETTGNKKLSSVRQQKLIVQKATTDASKDEVMPMRFPKRLRHSLVASRHEVTADNEILTNKTSLDPSIRVVECDPTLEEADVGILSSLTCGEGQVCQESSESKLGGVCSAVARDLITCPSYCTCTSAYKSCHKTYQGVICGKKVYDTYVRTLTYSAGNPSSYQRCYTFTQPYTAKICYYFYYGKKGCALKVNGVSCNSCQVHAHFDCSNIPNGLSSGYYGMPIIQALQMKIGPFCTSAPPPTNTPPTSPVAPPTRPPPPVAPPTPPVAPPTKPPPTSPVAPPTKPPPTPTTNGSSSCGKAYSTCSNSRPCCTGLQCTLRSAGGGGSFQYMCSIPPFSSNHQSLAKTQGGAAGAAARNHIGGWLGIVPTPTSPYLLESTLPLHQRRV